MVWILDWARDRLMGTNEERAAKEQIKHNYEFKGHDSEGHELFKNNKTKALTTGQAVEEERARVQKDLEKTAQENEKTELENQRVAKEKTEKARQQEKEIAAAVKHNFESSATLMFGPDGRQHWVDNNTSETLTDDVVKARRKKLTAEETAKHAEPAPQPQVATVPSKPAATQPAAGTTPPKQTPAAKEPSHGSVALEGTDQTFDGYSGESVRKLQAMLGMSGSELDGVIGDHTKAKITKYQHDHHLTEDGIAGSETLNALNGVTAKKSGPIKMG